MRKSDFWKSDLSFLNQIASDRSVDYQTSPILMSPFQDAYWVLDFSKHGQITLDFNIKLDDGSLLTQSKNQPLLQIFKSWICIQTHRDVTRGIEYKLSTVKSAVSRVISLIDFFLLNSKYFKLSTYGLSNVTENDIVMMLSQLSSSNEISEGIYKWKSLLSEFLRKEIKKHTQEHLLQIIELNPLLSRDVPDLQDRTLDLSDEEVVFSRAALWDGEFYGYHHQTNTKNNTFRFAPKTKLITQILYSDTLRGNTGKPIPLELLLSPFQNYTKEFPSVPVRSEEETLQERQWLAFKSTFYSLGYLNEIYPQIPLHAIESVNQISKYSFALGGSKRFRTIHPKIVLESLRQSLDFALANGEDILESALRVIKAAKDSNVQSLVSFNNLDNHLTPKARDMGVKVWHLSSQMILVDRHPFTEKNQDSSGEYFRRLRANEGLYELVRILFGAIQFCVGTLMARRQSELIELISGQCLDENKTHLIFFNRKTGFFELRSKESRPLPPVAVKLVELIQNFHRKLAEILDIKHPVNLFAYPELHTGLPIKFGYCEYNINLNMFCDYSEVLLNDSGQRYYYRQHQLRRFFAMTFFWANSFGGMETLRWFLGHSDVEHLYHYITESTPGQVLTSSKAMYGAEVVKSDCEDISELRLIIQKRFRTNNFKLLDSDELTEFIEDLIIEGKLEIEPSLTP